MSKVDRDDLMKNLVNILSTLTYYEPYDEVELKEFDEWVLLETIAMLTDLKGLREGHTDEC